MSSILCAQNEGPVILFQAREIRLEIRLHSLIQAVSANPPLREVDSAGPPDCEAPWADLQLNTGIDNLAHSLNINDTENIRKIPLGLPRTEPIRITSILEKARYTRQGTTRRHRTQQHPDGRGLSSRNGYMNRRSSLYGNNCNPVNPNLNPSTQMDLIENVDKSTQTTELSDPTPSAFSTSGQPKISLEMYRQ